LFAKYDEKCTGELSYKEFIQLLKSETDFLDSNPAWLLPKGPKVIVPDHLKNSVDPQEEQRRLETKHYEYKQLFLFLDKQGNGYLDDSALGVALTVVGADLTPPGLPGHIQSLKGWAINGKVDFETFWSWWLTQVA